MTSSLFFLQWKFHSLVSEMIMAKSGLSRLHGAGHTELNVLKSFAPCVLQISRFQFIANSPGLLLVKCLAVRAQ